MNWCIVVDRSNVILACFKSVEEARAEARKLMWIQPVSVGLVHARTAPKLGTVNGRHVIQVDY